MENEQHSKKPRLTFSGWSGKVLTCDAEQPHVRSSSAPARVSKVTFSSFAKEVLVSEDSSKKLQFGELSKTRQYALKQEMKKMLNSMFDKNRMDDEWRLEFLQYMEKDVLCGRVASSQENCLVMKKQLDHMSLQDRNTLIRLLTHKEQAVDENYCEENNVTVINEDMLDIFPSLRNRSRLLAKTVQRKTRDDKIDLEFISDFMHKYCR